ncbi:MULTISPECIES: hypothetical protein [Devosia]|uniref:Uncharacterized protein n=1 Tax=Devosia equisanguinis TaxID=2490941 RepID=A0A3S4DNH7_9HYPH|nr:MULTISPECIES: hypothetical protein [Devosia]VDS03473.1 hypothetical protein DEVEQU_00596 [Devosia equisanguinis]
MSTTFILALILFIFGTFGAALAYAQIVAHGIVAPGGRKPD